MKIKNIVHRFLFTVVGPAETSRNLHGLKTRNKTWKKYSGAKIDIAAKRNKIHKNNNLHIGISNSYGRQKHKSELFTRPSKLESLLLYQYG